MDGRRSLNKQKNQFNTMIYLDNTTQSQQVYIPRQVIQTATTREINNITSGDVINIVDEKLEPYYNSAETDTQIENAVAAESARCEETYAKIEDIPDVSNLVTSADVKTQVEDYHYITSGQAQEQINQSLSGYATEQWVEDKHYLTEHQSLSGYASEEYVDNAVNGAIDYVDDQFSSYSQEFTGYLAEKQDITAMTAYYTSAETDTQIENAIAAEIERADSTYATPSDIPDVSEFITSADAKTQIEAYNYVNSGDVETQITDKNYVTSADVETQITDKNYITSATVKDVFVNFDVTSGDSSIGSYIRYEKLGGGYRGRIFGRYINGEPIILDQPLTNLQLPTSADVETQITNKNYVTSATVQTQIDGNLSAYTPTSNFATINGSAITEGGNIVIQGGGGVDSGLTERVDEIEEVTSRALNDLNTRFSAYTPTSGFATINGSAITEGGNIIIQGGSGGNANIIELTQAEYDALTAYTEDALYVITDAEEVDLNDYATSGDIQTLSAATVTALSNIYAPTTAGDSGQVVVSNGSGASWSSFKFWYGSQLDYDLIWPKDNSTIYFIID